MRATLNTSVYVRAFNLPGGAAALLGCARGRNVQIDISIFQAGSGQRLRRGSGRGIPMGRIVPILIALKKKSEFRNDVSELSASLRRGVHALRAGYFSEK
jgi:hypothetical protein